MLSVQEKEFLEDQEGPLSGRPLFGTVWRSNQDLAELFIEFCKTHRPARYIDWSRSLKDGQLRDYFVESVVQLELATRDMGETIDAFLNAIPAPLSSSALHTLKAALGTEEIPVLKTKPKASSPKDLLRAAHNEVDRLLKAHRDGKRYPEDAIDALVQTLQTFTEPPVDPRQFSALMEMIADPESLKGDPQVVHRIAHFVHFNLPHHEPILKEFTRWCEDPNRPQRDVVEVGLSDWIPKLIDLELVDRQHAARTMCRVINSPKLKEHVSEFRRALQID